MEKIYSKIYSKKDLVELIKGANKKISILGSTIFDLPWDELYSAILEKFKTNDEFTLEIIRESEPIIAQYALLTESKVDNNFEAYTRGNLNGVKDEVIKKLRNKLKEDLRHMPASQKFNIEPVEDIKKNELANLAKITEHDYMLEVIETQKLVDEVHQKIKEESSKAILKMINDALADSLKSGKISAIDLGMIFGNIQGVAPELSEIIADTALNYYDSKNKKFLPTQIQDPCQNFITALDGKLKVDELIYKLPNNTLFKIKIDISKIESFTRSLIKNYSSYDREKNYRLNDQRTLVEKRITYLRDEKIKEYNNDRTLKQRLFIYNCYLPMPIPMIRVDDVLLITQALTKFNDIKSYQLVGGLDKEVLISDLSNKPIKYSSQWIKEYRDYFKKYFSKDGAIQYCTEETDKGDRLEVIDVYNEQRIKIGSGPRDAFLSNPAIVKSVVWALIFTRDGRLLIHQRSNNAKDNRGLWDKSVGGHVSIEDLDTIEAIKREITEELFSIENEGQGGHNKEEWMMVNMNKIVYLGDWRTKRFPDLNALGLERDEYYTFSLNYQNISRKDMRHDWFETSRLLPDGEHVKAKCFADCYMSIVSEEFDVKKLQNSKFALMTPNELKRCVLAKKAIINSQTREYDAKNGEEVEFTVTSDLNYLVTHSIWDDVVTEFARKVKETFDNK